MSGDIASISEIKPHVLPNTIISKADLHVESSKHDFDKKPETDSIAQELKEQDLQKISKDLNEKMKRMHSDITFSYNEDIGGLVVTIKDDHGNRVIREIPPQEVIKLTKKMRDIVGILFDKKG
ncbi:flagellar protein FlaG [Helicobacter baculiformis]|uniref:Flagellar protein FlaG n=1 Tax=Helicobacter baculiformis TaxID=427351 RepID=A0ABV7ZG08_9HELI|nr:flagellar protein FlaG [Helicobacter baculiformis]